MAKKKAPIKGPGGKPGYFAKAPIRRVMKEQGAELVASEALDQLMIFLEKSAVNVINNALKIAKEDKRKRITATDIKNATR